jgi:hypothetical protein
VPATRNESGRIDHEVDPDLDLVGTGPDTPIHADGIER